MTSASLVSTQTPVRSSSTTASQTASTPLPVLDVLNNVITVTNYINAIQSAALPAAITTNPQYASLATDYANWQYTIWAQYYEGLVDGNIVAQAEQINTLVQTGVDFPQSVYAAVVNPGSTATPAVIALCDDVANQVAAGSAYVSQLLTIAQGIQGADKAKLAALNAIVDTLNTQFDQMEQQLTDKAIDNTKEAVVTFITVSVAVATDEDPVEPLAKGVAQVGTDIVEELMLSDEINATLGQLETAWKALDEETLQLAQINLIINRLNQVVNQTSKAITALNAIVDDWQTVCDTINESPAIWQSSGLSQLTEWASRMNNVNFATVPVQTVS